MSLIHHLGNAYKAQVGMGKNEDEAFIAYLKEHPGNLAEARTKRDNLAAVMRSRPGSCFISNTHLRALNRVLSVIDGIPIQEEQE